MKHSTSTTQFIVQIKTTNSFEFVDLYNCSNRADAETWLAQQVDNITDNKNFDQYKIIVRTVTTTIEEVLVKYIETFLP